jgi:hypothetical protein
MVYAVRCGYAKLTANALVHRFQRVVADMSGQHFRIDPPNWSRQPSSAVALWSLHYIGTRLLRIIATTGWPRCALAGELAAELEVGEPDIVQAENTLH